MEIHAPLEPEILFASLLAAARHPRKRRNLHFLNELCKRRFEAKASDWAYSSIGKLLEEQGYLKLESLQQKQSRDYRALIDAWKAAQIAGSGAIVKSSNEPNKWYDAITDVVARTLAASLETQIHQLQKENRLLERLKQTISFQPDGSFPTSPNTIAKSQETHLLNVQEKRVLIECVNKASLERLQLRLGERGELLTDDGVILFGAGWAFAIKKALSLLGA